MTKTSFATFDPGEIMKSPSRETCIFSQPLNEVESESKLAVKKSCHLFTICLLEFKLAEKGTSQYFFTKCFLEVLLQCEALQKSCVIKVNHLDYRGSCKKSNSLDIMQAHSVPKLKLNSFGLEMNSRLLLKPEALNSNLDSDNLTFSQSALSYIYIRHIFVNSVPRFSQSISQVLSQPRVILISDIFLLIQSS